MPFKDTEKQKEYMRNYAKKNREKLREIGNRYYKNKKNKSQGKTSSKDPLVKICEKCQIKQPHVWMKDPTRNAGGRYKHACERCIRAGKRRIWHKERATGRIQLREKLKNKCVQYLGEECLDCKIRYDCPAIYDFHHRDPKTKIESIGQLLHAVRVDLAMSKKLIKELDKCDLLCANCHRKRHYKDKSAMTGRPAMD